MRVLLVEDNSAYAKLITKLLHAIYRKQVDVLHRTSLGEGIEACRTVPVDVVLLDLHLPDSSGLETLFSMLAVAECLPIVVLTGVTDEETSIQAVTAGAEDYLLKGQTDPGLLRRSIRYAMERKSQKMRIRESEERLSGIINLAQDAIISTDDQYRIILFNPAAEAIFKRDRMEVIGEDLSILLPVPARAHHREHMETFARGAVTSQFMNQRGEVFGLRRDGTEFPAEVTISRLNQGENLIYTAVVRDITDRKKAEKLLREMATTDALTGAYNRRQFFDLAERELERSRRYGLDLSLAMIDVDHFKQINDRFGHLAGDDVLKAIVVTFQGELRPSDILGRFGGEEFVLLLPQTGKEGAATIAERLRCSLKTDRFYVRDVDGVVSASIGVTSLSESDTGFPSLITRADAALYEAKRNGRDRVEAL